MNHDRDYFIEGLEVRDGGPNNAPMLSGYAAVFNQETTIRMGPEGAWRERIVPGAFDRVLQSADVIAAVNHDHRLLLGRTKSGTLKLSSDERGLRYDVQLPKTQLGADVREQVRRGDLVGSSFKFGVDDGDVEVVKGSQRHESGMPLLLIRNVSRLLDVGPVVFPAYSGTSVVARSIPDAFRQYADVMQHEHEIELRNRHRIRIAIERARAWAP